jgi:hypothetical protein
MNVRMRELYFLMQFNFLCYAMLRKERVRKRESENMKVRRKIYAARDFSVNKIYKIPYQIP